MIQQHRHIPTNKGEAVLEAEQFPDKKRLNPDHRPTYKQTNKQTGAY